VVRRLRKPTARLTAASVASMTWIRGLAAYVEDAEEVGAGEDRDQDVHVEDAEADHAVDELLALEPERLGQRACAPWIPLHPTVRINVRAGASGRGPVPASNEA
jgi:hypothetical protein